MAFNPFYITPEDARSLASSLGLKVTPRVYIQGKPGAYKIAEIYEIEEQAEYERLREELMKTGEYSIVAGDKVYILSGGLMAIPRWESYLKKIGASRVSNIDKATVIVQNSQALPDRSWEDSITTYHQLNKHYVYTLDEKGLSSTFPELKYEEPEGVFLVERPSASYTRGGRYIMYPSTIKLLERVKAGVNFVHEKNYVELTNLGTILDEATTKSLLSMTQSSDTANHVVAREILYQCNIEKSWYWIWRIAESQGSYAIESCGHDKNGKLFLENSEFFKIRNMAANSFAKFLHEKGLLTEEIFRMLKCEISEHALNAGYTLNSFYKVRLIIRPEFTHLDPNMEHMAVVEQKVDKEKEEEEKQYEPDSE